MGRVRRVIRACIGLIIVLLLTFNFLVMASWPVKSRRDAIVQWILCGLKYHYRADTWSFWGADVLTQYYAISTLIELDALNELGDKLNKIVDYIINRNLANIKTSPLSALCETYFTLRLLESLGLLDRLDRDIYIQYIQYIQCFYDPEKMMPDWQILPEFIYIVESLRMLEFKRLDWNHIVDWIIHCQILSGFHDYYDYLCNYGGFCRTPWRSLPFPATMNDTYIVISSLAEWNCLHRIINVSALIRWIIKSKLMDGSYSDRVTWDICYVPEYERWERVAIGDLDYVNVVSTTKAVMLLHILGKTSIVSSATFKYILDCQKEEGYFADTPARRKMALKKAIRNTYFAVKALRALGKEGLLNEVFIFSATSGRRALLLGYTFSATSLLYYLKEQIEERRR